MDFKDSEWKNTIKSHQLIWNRKKAWELDLRPWAQGTIAEGSRGPQPNLKHSGLETLRLGLSLSLFVSSWVSGSQWGCNKKLFPQGLCWGLNLRIWLPQNLSLTQLPSAFLAWFWTGHSPCPVLVLPKSKIISSNEVKNPNYLAFSGLKDAGEIPLKL